VSAVSARLREAAASAERIAGGCQQAELAGPRADPRVIGGLQFVADILKEAASTIDPAPVASLRSGIQAVSTTGVWVACSALVLLVVPNPSRPGVLAGAVGGGYLVAGVWNLVVGALWNRGEVRGLAAVVEPGSVQDEIAELHNLIARVTGYLDIDRTPAYLAIGEQIEYAQIWLDEVERLA
jgi:hypothetical protein